MLDILGKSTFDEAYEEWCLNPDVDNSKESFLADAYFRIVTYDDELTLYYGKLIREIILQLMKEGIMNTWGLNMKKITGILSLLLIFFMARGCWFNAEAKELIEFCRT